MQTVKGERVDVIVERESNWADTLREVVLTGRSISYELVGDYLRVYGSVQGSRGVWLREGRTVEIVVDGVVVDTFHGSAVK